MATCVVLLDIVTKWMAVQSLMPRGLPREVFGEWARLTLVYNRGAAFGLDLGPYSRWIFLVLTLVALVILGRLYRATVPGDRRRVLALSLVCGGAVGNLIDRVRSPLGVVDFLDIGVGAVRWPTFNVADIAVTIGAVLLAWSLWSEDRVAARSEAAPKGALS
ncbi:MAG: signal peptidase II [Gemmatimonadaceae bacterium]